MSPSRVGKQDHHMWSVVKPWEPRLKRDLQGRTERTLAVRTLSDSCFVDIETGVGWWGLSDSICLFCLRFSTFIPLITDDINQLSFLTWSTSMYRVLRDLPTFDHIPNKSRSLGDIGKVACSVTPSATCPLNVSLRYPWKIPQQNSHVLFCHSPSRHLQRLGVASSFTRAYYFWHSLYSTTWSPNRPVAQSLPHLDPFRCPWHQFFRWTRGIAGMQHEIKRFGRSPKIGPHACHCEMSPSRVGKRDHHMWSVVKPWKPRLKRDLQGRTERTLAVRTLSDSCFVDIETGVHWWGLSDSICLPLYEFQHSSPWSPMTSTTCLFWHGRRGGTGFSVICLPLVTYQIKAAHWET